MSSVLGNTNPVFEIDVSDAVLIATVSDTKTDGTNGGTFTSGSRVTRTLNTLVEYVGGVVSLASNVITFTAAGTFFVRWSCPGYKCGLHRSALYNVTGTADLQLGSSENSGTADAVVTRSHGAAKFSAAVNQQIRIEHRCSSTQTTNGLGLPATFSEVETYTIAEIWRLY